MTLYRTRRLGTIDFASTQKKTLDIARDGVLIGLNLRVQYTVTNGGSAAVGPLFQALARIVRRVELVIGGRDTVISQAGEMLAMRARLDFGTVLDGMADTVVLTGSAVTVYDITIPIALTLPRSRTPVATAIDLRRVRQATAEITWANSDCSDLYTTPNSAAISAVTCWVEGHFLMRVPEDQAFLVRQLSEITQDYSATNSALSVTIDGQTGLAIRSLLIASTVAIVGSNAPLNAGSITISSGAFTHHERLGPAVQAENKHLFGQESLVAGVYFMPFTWAGDLSMAIDTDPNVISADLKALFDVTFTSGVHTLKLGVESVRPPKIS